MTLLHRYNQAGAGWAQKDVSARHLLWFTSKASISRVKGFPQGIMLRFCPPSC